MNAILRPDPSAADVQPAVVPLERADDLRLCGGKALGLARLLRAGMPVPSGLVVTDAARRRFFSAGGLDEFVEATLDAAVPGELASLEAASASIRERIVQAEFPPALWNDIAAAAGGLAREARLAVRSSAAGEDGRSASFAGQLDSLLGVEGEAQLQQAIKRCWASRWSLRALAYERARGQTLGGMGVILQRQVDAAYAGVLFTVSPEPGRAGEMLCEFCEGLGDRLVAGEIAPERVGIARDGFELHRPAGAAAGPAPEAIRRLAAVARAAERLFAAPQDIEWAVDAENAVWVLQSRPITAAGEAGARRVTWSNANVNENFPLPVSPLLYSVAAPGYTNYFRNLGRAFGLSRRRLARMANDLATIIGVHGGRIYYNLTSIHSVLRNAPFGERLARWFDDFVGAEAPAGAPEARPRRAADALELAWIAVKTTWQYLFLRRRVEAFERLVDEYASRTEPAALASRSMLQLRDDLRAFQDIRCNRWTGAALADAAAMVCYGVLKALVGRAFPQEEHPQLHHALLKGIGGLASAEPVDALWRLSRQVRENAALRELFERCPAEQIAGRLRGEARFAAFQSLLEEYLRRWGFRFSGELMLTLPSLQERPEPLLAMIARHAEQEGGAPAERLEQQRRERLETTGTIFRALGRRRLLRALPWPTQATLAKPVLAAAQAAIAFRERARLKQALLYSRLRRVALQIGARLAREGRLESADDVFMLALGELDELLSGTAMFPDSLRAQVAVRKRAHAEFARLEPPAVLTAPEGAYPACASEDGDDRERGPRTGRLSGTAVCGGVVVGRARVLADMTEASRLESGEILVTRQTDPGWAPVFVAIGGLVLERGGMLSHGAILAREYGIPTLVGVAGATEHIPDRAIVKVDANRGVVEIVR